jgi:Protein of unknown function (DUF3054)
MTGRLTPSTVGFLGLDVVAVLVFVAIGRDTHDGGIDIGGLLSAAAPFLIALALGWLIAQAWVRPSAWTTGVMVWFVTLGFGMGLRRVVFDRGTATAFVIVATVFLGFTLMGWRLAIRKVMYRRPGQPTGQLH